MLQEPVQQPTIIFLHILKTAGTTLNVIMENYFSDENSFATFPNRLHPNGNLDDFYRLTAAEKEKIDFLTGHMGFGLHEYLPRPAVYVTILRDPVERVISRYYHIRRDPASHLYKDTNSTMDLARFIRYCTDVTQSDNLQTRMIAGNWEKRGFGPCDEAMFIQAKQNLRDHFAVVGLTEAFDTTYFLIKEVFGWQPVFYGSHNVGRKRPHRDNIQPETIALIKQHNRYDIALYQFAQTLFQERIAAQGSDFFLRLKLFQGQKRLYHLYWAFRKISVRTYIKNKFG